MLTLETLTAHNITKEEYERILKLMGREPTFVELGVFSVMWSEHCSYKSSRVHLKRLPTHGERVIVPPGENAGVVDVGDGWCAAFKVESHNHPSFIEPFQGAATGVGGILRDIFTMGARPVAAMNSIRFGRLDDKEHARRNRRLLSGVVGGIAHYGNAFGVATVGGETVFDAAYNFNPLVNAFALGLVREDGIFFGKATGLGNPVLYVGAKTGRDGIHGATMASAEFDDAALEKRPTVQVGDPFLEKLLLEACLEAMRSGGIAGIQDMGAAGLTSSSCEMAARAGTGLDLDLDLVPQRETGMTAYEMMLSESQERMLIVAHKGREREIIDIFRKWDLDAVVVGTVTDTERLAVRHKGELQADIPVTYLTDEAPVYQRPLKARTIEKEEQTDASTHDNHARHLLNYASLESNEEQIEVSSSPDYAQALLRLIASPNIASKRWVYRQYDYMVRTNTVVLPGADAAVVRIKETRRALAMCLDGNGRRCAVNPREGAKHLVAEAARNVVCVGATPIAITNCLNFASPERPEVMWDFSETIDGMAEACRMFDTPVISGNVSFYNETDGRGIPPTPVIGMVGLIEDVRRVIQPGFKAANDFIAVLGRQSPHDDARVSEYAAFIEGKMIDDMKRAGVLPPCDLEGELRVQKACLALSEASVILSAHDIADGGFAVALAECCFSSHNRTRTGATIELTGTDAARSMRVTLFGEAGGRIIVSFADAERERFTEIIAGANCPYDIIGRTTDDDTLNITIDAETISLDLAALETAWRTGLDEQLSQPSTLLSN
ncbi:MAG: phosphoribosylformylglycinamidine synthase subunit PurL [Pyrinomonadaceae bacterium MAG19_C2-C3]|nr:phosphoribosylformylglycinamidine synthase subunit PurL [Pyrinomonadaceae bacterium MAG19_C2-C3]